MEMSAKERERAHVIRQVSERRTGQARAAELLGIGVRQVKRLVSAYRRFGDRGLVSGRRGKPSNNRLAAATVARMERALRERYADSLQYGLLAYLRADIALAHPRAFCAIKGIVPAS